MNNKIKKILKRMIWGFLGLILLIAIAIVILLQQPSFGKLPEGKRLEIIQKSPNYKDEIFQNQSPTPMMTGNKSRMRIFWEFMFAKIKDLKPAKNIPSVKTDFKNFAPNQAILVWLGHSSIYLQTRGKRILVDPVLVSGSPVSFINKAFSGSDIYSPEDMPKIDYIIITHDHWDHLDYKTIMYLKSQVKKIICPLGIGSHLEYWGVDLSVISELDWYDSLFLDENIKLTMLPARHFSGRGLRSNQTLWAGYMLQSDFGNMFFSGDTGYGQHFKEIKEKFGTIDFAIMENGQYNEDWKYMHTIPEDLVKAVAELQPKKLMTVHNSKFALARHAWYEPLQKITEASKKHSFNLITPKIGEPVFLQENTQTFTKWWEDGSF